MNPIVDTTGHATLVARATVAVERLAQLAKPRAAEWLRLDLTMGQLKAVFLVAAEGPTPVGSLARALGITEPAASTMVGKLEERGLLARHPDVRDRRRTLVAVSNDGRELVDRLRRVRNEQLGEWLGRMDESDLRTLLQGAEALLRAADSGAGDRSPEKDSA